MVDTRFRAPYPSTMVEPKSPIRFEAIHSSVEIRRPAPGIVLAVFDGRDVGELGDAPFRELAGDLAAGKFELFIDARQTSGASVEVSGDWSQWFAENRDNLHRVNMLTGSRFIQMTAELVRRVSQLGERMRIYTDPAAFDATLEASIATRRVYVGAGARRSE